MRKPDPRLRTDEIGHSSASVACGHGALELERTMYMTGSLHVGLAALGAAIGVGLIGMGASTAVGRNPGASTKIMVQSILAIAFAEAIVFYALFLVR